MKGFFSKSEVAKILDVSTRVLDNWEKSGFIKRLADKKYRMEQIPFMYLISKIRSMGFSYQSIRGADLTAGDSLFISKHIKYIVFKKIKGQKIEFISCIGGDLVFSNMPVKVIDINDVYEIMEKVE